MYYFKIWCIIIIDLHKLNKLFKFSIKTEIRVLIWYTEQIWHLPFTNEDEICSLVEKDFHSIYRLDSISGATKISKKLKTTLGLSNALLSITLLWKVKKNVCALTFKFLFEYYWFPNNILSVSCQRSSSTSANLLFFKQAWNSWFLSLG